MPGGYMGKMLFVDLSTGELKDEALDEKLARDFMGGYGLGARIIFSRQKAGVNPLGPHNMLGFITGVLTGTPALGGSRFVVVSKSPLTGGWGDANSGGDWGPYLKFAGYDAVFFTGIAEKPVYLYIEDGKAGIRDASHLWGKDTYETEDMLKNELGREVRVACIGPSGELLSLISGVSTDRGRLAGRSGMGAVMGSKNLKAIALKGTMKVPVADEKKASEMRKKHLANMGPRAGFMGSFGTSGLFNMSIEADDTPTKNWAGTGIYDFPDYKDIGGEAVIARQEKKYGCWHCPVACGGIMKGSTGEYQYDAGVKKPEYETLAMFGSNCLNSNLDSIIKANDICNRYGLDTISAGACIAFAIECYENGLLIKNDTDGIEMTWGNHRSIVAMTEKIAKREGFGDILADGVKIAAEKIGKGSEKYAMHAGGQEIPAHDTRGGNGFAIAYALEPTPGRHTQSGEVPQPEGAIPELESDPFMQRPETHKACAMIYHVMNACGGCMIAYGDGLANFDQFIESFNVITGWDITREEILKTGERIDNTRQAFNIREGLKMPFALPDRMMGIPPKTVGPRANVTLPEDLFIEYLEAMGWDPDSCKPSNEKLLELGLDDVAKELSRI
jgi:aldehyde:ferredoxin oxidoreductase